jgi:ABC-type branched-subunit amino acid transport system permease subunit
MKIIKIASIIIIAVLIFFCVLLTKNLLFRINPLYNEMDRYFDETSGVVYHSQTIIGIAFYLLICILAIISVIIIYRLINKKIK